MAWSKSARALSVSCLACQSEAAVDIGGDLAGIEPDGLGEVGDGRVLSSLSSHAWPRLRSA